MTQLEYEADERGEEVCSKGRVKLRNERFVIFSLELVNGRDKVTTYSMTIARTEEGLNSDQVIKISRLSGCENFVCDRDKSVIQYVHYYFEPVERFENRRYATGLGALTKI